jgi:hypothetical protein
MTRVGLAVTLMATVAIGTAVHAQHEFSPHNKDRGRAAVEYTDKDVHIVAAYYYSQRHHDSRWIVIDAALSTEDRDVLPRTAFVLRTPDGREVPLATQSRVGEDTVNVQKLMQNARVEGHDILSYFPQRDHTYSMKFFTFPFGGVVSDNFIVDHNEVATGPLFFEAPTGAWEKGTYALVVHHAKGVAELPIRLE